VNNLRIWFLIIGDRVDKEVFNDADDDELATRCHVGHVSIEGLRLGALDHLVVPDLTVILSVEKTVHV
jgi:hypothetical protein